MNATRTVKRRSFGRAVRDFALRVHRDEGGSFGILLLFVIWALVLLIALIWNTQELSSRRLHVQNSADSAALALSKWMSRVTNQESATNMVIAQNASAEILLRSVQPTADSIAQRLTNEERTLRRRMWGNTPSLGELNLPDFEFFEQTLGTGEWAGNNALGAQLVNVLKQIQTETQSAVQQMGSLLSPQQITNIQTRTLDPIPLNIQRIEYLEHTWIEGSAPTNGWQDPPEWNGQRGLRAILGGWIQDLRSRYQTTLDAIPMQWAIWQQFVDQTNPAMATDPASLAERRNEIHQYQLEFADTVAQAAQEQAEKLSKLYKTNITIANPFTGSAGSEGSGSLTGNTTGARVEAPVAGANTVESMDHTDSIRIKYPDAAERRFGTTDPRIVVDPINVHVDFAALWHPGAQTQRNGHNYGMGGGEWGAIACAPLARYINDRVSRDELDLANMLAQIDNIRQGIRGRVYPPSQYPSPIAQLQMQQGSATTTPPSQVSLQPQQLAQIPKPAGLPPELSAMVDNINSMIQQYNQKAQQYVSAISQMNTANGQLLTNLAQQTRDELNTTTQNFAEQTWRDIVNRFRASVLKTMGELKEFMVLKPYKLDHIPDWAKQGMQQSAYQLVYNDLYNRHIDGMIQRVFNDLQNDFRAQGMDAGQAAQQANAQAPGIARSVTAELAARIATDVSQEWIERPWPYEITPPEKSGDENSSGWLNVDRPKYFTLLAGATNTAAIRPDYSLQSMMGEGPRTLALFAQAEAFNWMEYNATYGKGDSYNQVTSYGHNVYGGSPTPWRLSTIGGWTWEGRLAVSDQLPPALELNPDFKAQFTEAGVPGIDAESLKSLIMH
jgi:hypothetical protein